MKANNNHREESGPPDSMRKKKKALKIIQKQMQQALILHKTQAAFNLPEREGSITRTNKINNKKLDQNNQRAAYSMLQGLHSKKSKFANSPH